MFKNWAWVWASALRPHHERLNSVQHYTEPDRARGQAAEGAPGRHASGSGASRPWRGLSPAERDAARRQRLLDAGLELFGTKGFRATTVQALCAEAGVATRSFYELFGSHDAIIAELYDQITSDISARMDVSELVDAAVADLDGPPTPELAWQVARMGLAVALEPVLRDERKARIIEIEVVGLSEEMEQRRATVVRGMADNLEATFAALERANLARSRSGGLVGLMAIGGITQSLLDHLRTAPELRRSTDEFIDELAHVLVLLIEVNTAWRAGEQPD